MGCILSKDKSNASPKVNKNDMIQTTNSPLSAEEIESRIECSKDIRVVNIGALSLAYGYLTQRGYYPDCKLQNYIYI